MRGDSFQIFYRGMNAGGIAAAFIVGTLGETVGWHWGFGAAGVGMLIALGIYLSGQKYLPKEYFEPQNAGRKTAAPGERMSRSDWLALLALILRSEEHTSELQSLMRISYAVFCLKKNTEQKQQQQAK